MTMAEKFVKIIEDLDIVDEKGFSMMSWGEIVRIAEDCGAVDIPDCACGSQYCEVCQGSVDPSISIRFEDGSIADISNPREVVYPRMIFVR